MTQQYTYQVKAVNSDTDTCECCGKSDLNKVVWLVEVDEDGNETGEPVAYGTTCAARKLGFNSKNTKAQNERKVNEAQAEYKKQARVNYFNTQCIKVETAGGIVMIDKQYRIGKIMQEQNIDRNQAIAWARSQMNSNWFMN